MRSNTSRVLVYGSVALAISLILIAVALDRAGRTLVPFFRARRVTLLTTTGEQRPAGLAHRPHTPEGHAEPVRGFREG